MSLRPLSPPAGYQRDQPLMLLPLFQPFFGGVAVVNESKFGSRWYDSPNSRVLEVLSVMSPMVTCTPPGAAAALRAPDPVAMNTPSLVEEVAKIGREPPLAR